MAKTKARLPEAVWFPNPEKHVRAELEYCLACQATSQPNRPQPINVTPMPNASHTLQTKSLTLKCLPIYDLFKKS